MVIGENDLKKTRKIANLEIRQVYSLDNCKQNRVTREIEGKKTENRNSIKFWPFSTKRRSVLRENISSKFWITRKTSCRVFCKGGLFHILFRSDFNELEIVLVRIIRAWGCMWWNSFVYSWILGWVQRHFLGHSFCLCFTVAFLLHFRNWNGICIKVTQNWLKSMKFWS